MPNTAHFWTKAEIADLHLGWGEFTMKHPGITYHGWRHKKKDLGLNKPEKIEVPAAPVGGYVGFKTVYFDTESTDLKGMMGRILCASFADEFGNVENLSIRDYPGKNVIDDGPLCIAIRDRLNAADIVVGWNSKEHDIRLLNVRLLKAGADPVRGDILHIDLMWATNYLYKLGSRRLVSWEQFVGSDHSKTPLEWEVWQMAGAGDEKALDSVIEHCDADVLVLRDVFAATKRSIKNVHR